MYCSPVSLSFSSLLVPLLVPQRKETCTHTLSQFEVTTLMKHILYNRPRTMSTVSLFGTELGTNKRPFSLCLPLYHKKWSPLNCKMPNDMFIQTVMGKNLHQTAISPNLKLNKRNENKHNKLNQIVQPYRYPIIDNPRIIAKYHYQLNCWTMSNEQKPENNKLESMLSETTRSNQPQNLNKNDTSTTQTISTTNKSNSID